MRIFGVRVHHVCLSVSHAVMRHVVRDYIPKNNGGFLVLVVVVVVSVLAVGRGSPGT